MNKETPIPSVEAQREKFKGAQELGDLKHTVEEVSTGIDDLLAHAERIFRTYDMGSPFGSEKVDIELLRSAGRVVQEMKNRIEGKGNY